MTNLVLGTKTNGTSTNAGSVETYLLSIPTNGKYVFEAGGTSNVVVGVWGPFPPGTNPQPVPPYGRLRICGVNRWGVRMLTPGQYLVQVTQNTQGTYSILPRNWKFQDYFFAPFYRSTC